MLVLGIWDGMAVFWDGIVVSDTLGQEEKYLDGIADGHIVMSIGLDVGDNVLGIFVGIFDIVGDADFI